MSNAFLLLNYSFAFQGNKFDSYEVSLVKEPVSRNVEDIICFDYSWMKGIESARLQIDKLNYTLLSYLRVLFATDGEITEDKEVFTSDLKKEKDILGFY